MDMTFFTLSQQEKSDSLFKKPSGIPPRSRKNLSNCKSDELQTFLREFEKRYEVLRKLCHDQPDDLEKILKGIDRRLTRACYEKIAEKVYQTPRDLDFTIRNGTVCLMKARSSSSVAPVSHSPPLANIRESPRKSTQQEIKSTSKNHYGHSAPIIMSFFTLKNQRQSDSLLRKLSAFPSRSRKNFTNTLSTCKCESIKNSHTIFETVEEHYKLLLMLYHDQPDDLKKILNDTVEQLTQACYEKVAIKGLPVSNGPAFSIGGSCVCFVNTRSSVPVVSASHGPSPANIQESQYESTRRKFKSTSKNHSGLLHPTIPVDRRLNFLLEQFSKAYDVFYVHEPPQRTLTARAARPKKSSSI